MQDGFLMGSERIPCGLPTVTSPPKGQASGYEKKYFLTLDSLWLATGNINFIGKNPSEITEATLKIIFFILPKKNNPQHQH